MTAILCIKIKIRNSINAAQTAQLQTPANQQYEINTHIRYLIIFKHTLTYNFLFCGEQPIIKDHHITIGHVKIPVNPEYQIACSILLLQCDCGSIYELRHSTTKRRLDADIMAALEAQSQTSMTNTRNLCYPPPELYPKIDLAQLQFTPRSSRVGSTTELCTREPDIDGNTTILEETTLNILPELSERRILNPPKPLSRKLKTRYVRVPF